MTKGTKTTKNKGNSDAAQHSASFVALVELVRLMARLAAENDYEGMIEAAKKKEQLASAWKDKT